MAFHPLVLEGSAREISLRRGRALKDLIRAVVKDYVPSVRGDEGSPRSGTPWRRPSLVISRVPGGDPRDG
ncbi:MAG: hypothetical protein DRJ56_06635 [Thermoprotei archaeon]|nr:MAG: hypothetical protein DRJ56_06635 [Thermoprotei archaeon]